MIGSTNAGGGGSSYGSGDFAYIVVTYPAGSTLTCSNGVTILQAEDTIGAYIFGVPSAGTWTVTATDGTKTTSKAVTISTSGQIENVVMSYALQIISGTEFIKAFTTSYVNFGTDSGMVTMTGLRDGNYAFCFTTDAITTGSFTKAVARGTFPNVLGGYLSIWNGTTATPNNTNVLAEYQVPMNATEAEISIPSGTASVKVGFRIVYNKVFKISDLHLE